jgi:hypothetical protein
MKTFALLTAGALALAINASAMAADEHATGPRDPQAVQPPPPARNAKPKPAPDAATRHNAYLAEMRNCKGFSKRGCINKAKKKYGEM